MRKDKSKVKKNVLKRIIKILIIIILIPLVAFAVLVIYHLITSEKPKDYLSSEFLLYVEIESMGQLYEKTLDLKALEVLLTGQNKDDLFITLNNFKTGSIAKHPLFKGILDIEAHFQILDDGSPVFVLDPGIRSVFTRLIPIANKLYKIPSLDLNILQREGESIYEYAINEKTSIYLIFHNNLIFVGFNAEALLSMLHNKEDLTSISSLGNIGRLKKSVREQGIITCYVQMKKLLPYVLGEKSKEWAFINKKLFFPDLSILTVDISNAQFSMSFYTDIQYRNGILLDSLQEWDSGELKAVEFLPQSTNIYSGYKFSNFMDIYSLFLSLQEMDIEKTINKAESAAKTLLGVTIEDLFGWIGSEVGGFYINNSTKPVLFVEIENQAALDNFFDKITSSIFIKHEDNLIIDGIKIQKIGFPGFIQSIINLFVKNIDTPYYLQVGKYIYFSMDAETLVAVGKELQVGETLKTSENYQDIVNDFPKEASIFVYFDLSETMPAFLLSQPKIIDFMRFYEKGLLTFKINDTQLHLELSAVPLNERKARLYPGYPIPLENDFKNQFMLAGKSNKGLPQLVYAGKDNVLRVMNLSGKVLKEFSVDEKINLILPQDREKNAQELFAVTNKGDLYYLDYALNLIEENPYPGVLNQTFNPVMYNNEVYYYLLEDRKLRIFNSEQREDKEFPFSMLKPLHVSPAFSEDALALYPKDITGTVYLTDWEGEVLPGWPVRGGGVALSGPIIYQGNDKFLVIFLTQAGILNVWDYEGNSLPNFPLELDSVFYAAPVIINYSNNQYISVIDKNGNASVINLNGYIKANTKLHGISGKNTRIITSDTNNDNNSELYFYGDKDYILKTDAYLSTSPGFPVTGFTAPLFVDMDGNGIKELLSVGLDNKLYIYTIDE